ncbi:MAG TPA: serine--tRNA ligase [Chloroflexota bacterium]|nr:serine--tRNA ligase [Chloroflexota bacterium]
MLDLKFIRENPEVVREAARKKRSDLPLDELLALDQKVRQAHQQIQDLRHELNRRSKLVRDATPEERPELIAENRALGQQIERMEHTIKADEERLHELLLCVPNIPDESVPEGSGEDENVPIKYWGTPPRFDFTPRDHVALMEHLNMLDLERGAKVAGSRSYILKNAGALLELALVRFALDRVTAHGFTPLIVPALAREFALVGTGQFPTGRDQIYALPADDLFLVGTAEVSMTGMYAGEILPYSELPITMVAYSPCFRREAGTYGKDVRGVFRVHQFTKVEQYVICAADPVGANEWLEALRQYAEEIVQALELPYRVMLVCTGDMGDGKVKMYDIECWVPSEGRYRETHSDSSLHAWQARRANIRYRDEQGKVQHVFTLNNTALASPRIMVPLLENHQLLDGTVRVPAALQPYLGMDRIVPPAR